MAMSKAQILNDCAAERKKLSWEEIKVAESAWFHYIDIVTAWRKIFKKRLFIDF